jgi:uncharacterized protein (TIGR02145 family)
LDIALGGTSLNNQDDATLAGKYISVWGGQYTSYWSTTQSTYSNSVYGLVFSNHNISPRYSAVKSSWYKVRCIKDI